MTEQRHPSGRGASERTLWPRMSKEEINACPIKKYEGPVCLVRSRKELTRMVGQLEQESVLGFDTETRPTFRARESYPPAVLQLAGAKEVFIFQLQRQSLPRALCKILANPKKIKAGVALDRDLIELHKLTPFKAESFVDVAQLAKQAGIQNHGLRGLAAVLLGFRISKRAQTSNWAQKTLTPAQIRYAATDAWVGRQLYLKLREIMA